jgi:hypothetical protein
MVPAAGPAAPALTGAREDDTAPLLRGLTLAFAGRASGEGAPEAPGQPARDRLRPAAFAPAAAPANPGAEPFAVHVSVHLDGRQLGEAMASIAEGALTDAGGFDPRRNMLANT